ncbi:hypothetical protein GCM10022384_43970 [Streptomyces marokkonensis]|uniref:Uncharacterized protein n=1 Tax=Streptomyces marokkonensis TaxID=324855 RepID=A0ABP7R222_9ACTN
MAGHSEYRAPFPHWSDHVIRTACSRSPEDRTVVECDWLYVPDVGAVREQEGAPGTARRVTGWAVGTSGSP